jgi:hypothetical protein
MCDPAVMLLEYAAGGRDLSYNVHELATCNMYAAYAASELPNQKGVNSNLLTW